MDILTMDISAMLIHAYLGLSLRARYNVLSSAHCKHLLSGIIFEMSATNMLNNIGPNIEPCGTLNSDFKRVERCASICTKNYRKVK